MAARTHADAGYCTDCHSSSWNYSCSIASATVLATPIFADAQCRRAKLASDDCNSEVAVAFVAGPNWFLAQHV